MDIKQRQRRKNFWLLFLFLPFFFFPLTAWGLGVNEIDSTQPAETTPGVPVELNGDTVEYVLADNKMIAKGHVVITHQDSVLTCDEVEFYRDTKIAHASGHVRLKTGQGEITGEQMTVNFGTMKGDFEGAKMYAEPFYGRGQTISKVGPNKMVMKNGYMTTCDLDDPHYRLWSRTMDVYPKERLTAKNVRMFLGKFPLLYIPKFSQRLDGKEPWVQFTPGRSKEWGLFMLSRWRYYFNENFKGYIHLDAREKKDVAWGIDVAYKIPRRGEGIIRTYYMKERPITSKHFYRPRPSPTPEHERFKAEWRHQWDIDLKTKATLQYYKLSGATFLKDYFRRESEKDSSPRTFFLLTHAFPNGTGSFLTETRVNRFASTVQRIPELTYDLSNLQLGDTFFYLRHSSSYSNFNKKSPAPSEIRQKTQRVHLDDQLSYRAKVAFIEVTPFVGGFNTYYSRTLDPEKNGAIRGIFKTGSTLSTKFFRVFDVDFHPLKISRLRHVISPGVSYEYDHTPTILPAQLDQYDAIDSLNHGHNITFSLENKLQTKRDEKSVDLLRLLLSTNFHLKEDNAPGGFDVITADLDVNPLNWISFYLDAAYPTRTDRISTINFDLYLKGGSKWNFGFGKRFNVDGDDVITTQFQYKVNQKWALKIYERFDASLGLQREQEFVLTRDLHEWIADFIFNETRGEGTEILVKFTLKAFPDILLDIGTSFNQRKVLSQSSEGLRD